VLAYRHVRGSSSARVCSSRSLLLVFRQLRPAVFQLCDNVQLPRSFELTHACLGTRRQIRIRSRKLAFERLDFFVRRHVQTDTWTARKTTPAFSRARWRGCSTSGPTCRPRPSRRQRRSPWKRCQCRRALQLFRVRKRWSLCASTKTCSHISRRTGRGGRTASMKHYERRPACEGRHYNGADPPAKSNLGHQNRG
jgi:hypothetical protein